MKRYEDKKLTQLNVHTSSDKHGYGDVEVWNNDGPPFEMVEIKHNVPIDRNMIFDIVKKSMGTTIQRFYILTTSENNFLNSEEEEYINKFVKQIKKEYNIEIIANGILFTIKYYLRFIEDYDKFIKTYTQNLIEDAKTLDEVNDWHIKYWLEQLEELNVEV